METRKQLIIVAPMSLPLQKLNEVLNSIADEENIELTIIDDLKELSQFLGASGQCLIAFANAKKCATFLQENKAAIAKTHSKIILLTPKEIPAKTLIKFTKIGLTESILENSPPKTLLYKVKLLLRSIKSAAGNNDGEKDQIVKSMLDLNNSSANKEDSPTERTQNEEVSLNLLNEKVTKNKEQINLDLTQSNNFQAKKAALEDIIETHWKSKRKVDVSEAKEQSEEEKKSEESDPDKIENNHITKNQNFRDVIEEGSFKTKKLNSNEESISNTDKEKKKNDISIVDLTKNKEHSASELKKESDHYQLKSSNQPGLDLETNDHNDYEKPISEEEKAAKERELDELDEIIKQAQKRKQLLQSNEEDYTQNFASSDEDDEEDAAAEDEDKEYERDTDKNKKKLVELELEQNKPKSDIQNKSPSEERPKDKSEDDLNEDKKNPSESEVEHLKTRMLSDITKIDKKIRTHDVFTKNKSEDSPEEENVDEHSNQAIELTKDSPNPHEKLADDDRQNTNKELSPTLFAEEDDLDLKERSDEDPDKENKRQLTKEVDLLDGNQKDNDQKEDEPRKESSRRGAFPEPAIKKENLVSDGKVEKIDTFYRSHDSKSKEHDWNLNAESSATHLELSKKANTENALESITNKNGEQTIDYRKLKEEFDDMSRNGDSEAKSFNPHERNSNDQNDHEQFKVIELNALGLEFGIKVLNLLYSKECSPPDFYQLISNELMTSFKAITIFYTYKGSDKTHKEAFDGFKQMANQNISEELKEWWKTCSSDEAIISDYFSQAMPYWYCREMNWKNNELPREASELSTKKLELAYPYYDGTDRMGMCLLLFPEGLDLKKVTEVETILETARTVLLDSIMRIRNHDSNNNESNDKKEENKLANLISGIFKGKKAG